MITLGYALAKRNKGHFVFYVPPLVQHERGRLCENNVFRSYSSCRGSHLLYLENHTVLQGSTHRLSLLVPRASP